MKVNQHDKLGTVYDKACPIFNSSEFGLLYSLPLDTPARWTPVWGCTSRATTAASAGWMVTPAVGTDMCIPASGKIARRPIKILADYSCWVPWPSSLSCCWSSYWRCYCQDCFLKAPQSVPHIRVSRFIECAICLRMSCSKAKFATTNCRWSCCKFIENSVAFITDHCRLPARAAWRRKAESYRTHPSPSWSDAKKFGRKAPPSLPIPLDRALPFLKQFSSHSLFFFLLHENHNEVFHS